MLSIALPSGTEERLRTEASRRGMDVAAYARKLIEDALAHPTIDQATIDLLNQWDEEEATNDPAEIAQRRREVEEFKQAMNRNRRVYG